MGEFMSNPWNEVKLDDYENHMRLDTVYQLQTLNEMMKEQLKCEGADAVMILGIAGGNGLDHIEPGDFSKVYGVDINGDYLAECVMRYPVLKGIFQPLEMDLTSTKALLPQAELLIANLLIEYIGCPCFADTVIKVRPEKVSCIIQVNQDELRFVSDSPYLQAFDRLSEVHHEITETDLTAAMEKLHYSLNYKEARELPNGKLLVRLDYRKRP